MTLILDTFQKSWQRLLRMGRVKTDRVRAIIQFIWGWKKKCVKATDRASRSAWMEVWVRTEEQLFKHKHISTPWLRILLVTSHMLVPPSQALWISIGFYLSSVSTPSYLLITSLAVMWFVPSPSRYLCQRNNVIGWQSVQSPADPGVLQRKPQQLLSLHSGGYAVCLQHHQGKPDVNTVYFSLLHLYLCI